MAELLKGKPVVESMALDLTARIDALGRAGITPTLALVRVGARPDDLSYERTARKRAESLGIAIRPYELEEFAPQAAIEAAIHEVNADPRVHGCLLFRRCRRLWTSRTCASCSIRRGHRWHHVGVAGFGVHRGPSRVPAGDGAPASNCSTSTRCRCRASISCVAQLVWASPCP